MSPMRTEQEQIEGLRRLQRQLYQGWQVSAPIVLELGDVAALRLGAAEIVYATGDYDIWNEGNLIGAQLTEEAVMAVIVASDGFTGRRA